MVDLAFFQGHPSRARLTEDLKLMRRDGRFRAHLPNGKRMRVDGPGGASVEVCLDTKWPHAVAELRNGEGVRMKQRQPDHTPPLHEVMASWFEGDGTEWEMILSRCD